MSDLLQRSPIRPFSPFVLLRFSKEVATFLSYFYLFISFCKILSSLVNSSLHNFTSPFSPSFPPLLNYDSKHRLPLFSLLFIVFFSSILINGSPLFLSTNFARIEFYPFPFPFPSPTRNPSFPISNLVSPPPQPPPFFPSLDQV